MEFAHSDEIASDGLHMMCQMEGQKRDIDVLPFYWLEQVEQKLTQEDSLLLGFRKNEDLFLEKQTFP